MAEASGPASALWRVWCLGSSLSEPACLPGSPSYQKPLAAQRAAAAAARRRTETHMCVKCSV